MLASTTQREPSIPQYALDYVEAARETTARAPIEMSEQTAREDEGKGDGRGDATHVAASKPALGDEFSEKAFGLSENETANQRALRNAEANQPSQDGSTLIAASILAAETANTQDAQGPSFDQYRANGKDYASLQGQQHDAPQPQAQQPTPEQDGPQPQGRSLEEYAQSRGLSMNQQPEVSIPAYALDYVEAQKAGQQQEGPSQEPSIPDYAIEATRPDPNQPVRSNGLSR